MAWEGSVHVSPPERDALAALFETGLKDCFRLFDQPEKTFYWWDYQMLAYWRNARLRIDNHPGFPSSSSEMRVVSHRQGAKQAGAPFRPCSSGRRF